MSTKTKVGKIILIIPFALIAAALVLLVLFELAIMGANNIVARNTLHDITKIPLPENTEIVETISVAEKVVGNGNGMQYFGAVLLKSDLTVEELEDYYENPSEWQFVEKQDGQIISTSENYETPVTLYKGGEPLSFDTEINGDNYYIVYRWGSTSSELLYTLDIRGN